MRYDSYTDAARAIGVSKSSIQQALFNKRLIKKTYAIAVSAK